MLAVLYAPRAVEMVHECTGPGIMMYVALSCAIGL